MSQRKAVTKVIATRYLRVSKVEKGRILDELCATTGWHRSHARKALGEALGPKVVRPRRTRPPVYGPEVMAGLRLCWAVLGAPAGKRLAPFLPELVERLRRVGELHLDDVTAAQLAGMSAATIDRRLAVDRAKLSPRGRSHTKPGSLLKDAIPIRTWAQWDDAAPGFVEIDLVAHEGGNAAGDFCSTLTVTDIATGWTENRTVRNKAQKWVFAALAEITAGFPFPVKGIDSDNGSEFINAHLLRWCEQEDHLHPLAAGELQRRRARGAEELGRRAPGRRLPPLRHRGRTPAAEPDLVTADRDDQLLRAPTEAGVENPPRRQGDQEVRYRHHPAPARRGSPGRVEEDHDGARETLRRLQPRRRPARDPSSDRRALDPDHRQDRSPTETRPREHGHARIRI
jgi:hypothetical protein